MKDIKYKVEAIESAINGADDRITELECKILDEFDYIEVMEIKNKVASIKTYQQGLQYALNILGGSLC